MTNPNHSTGRVLLVDDSVDVRRLLGLYLRATDAHVVEAQNGRAACDLAYAAQNQRADFDLILLDMEMPELDGYAAATLLRMQGFAGAIVALTANDDAGERERCLASGCSEYLHKPVERDVLLDLVTRHLSARPQARAALDPSPASADDGCADAFLGQFLAGLHEYVIRLEELVRRESVEELAQTVHQIKGAAGMYGFDQIYDVAASAERVAKSLAGKGRAAAGDARRLREQIDALIGVIHSTCKGGRQATREVGVARR
jgi:CheY-like chemotaxis protein/HPt (histidine-containing phosphotransfer) domain-containing protein